MIGHDSQFPERYSNWALPPHQILTSGIIVRVSFLRACHGHEVYNSNGGPLVAMQQFVCNLDPFIPVVPRSLSARAKQKPGTLQLRTK
jgi:hypothetical protein